MFNADDATTTILDHLNISRQIIDASPAGMILADARLPDMPIVYINPAFERMTGYSRDEVVGQNCRFLQRDDRDQPELDVLRAALRDQTPCVVTLRNYHKDGTLFWNELRINPIYNTEGEVTHFYGIQNDVTASKQAEQQLKENEYRYRMLFEENKEAIFLIGLDGIFIRVNPRAAEMFGYTSEEMIGMHSFQLIAPEAHPQSEIMLARLKAGEKPPLYERWFVRKDGVRLLATANVALVCDHQGRPMHIQSILHDITDHHNLKIALQNTVDELDRFFTLSIDLLVVADTDGYFLKVNKAWEETLGYPLEILQGHRFLDFVHPDDLESTLQAIAELNTQAPVFNFINRYRRKDGTYRYLEWQSHPYGKLIYAAARDITDRLEIEAALRDSEARYRSVVNAMSEGIVLQAQDGTIQACNEAAERILGLTADQMMGRGSIDPRWRSIHEDGSPYPGDTHPAMVTLTTGEPVSNAIMGVHKPSGDLTWILINSRPIMHSDETQPSAVVASFSDITELKKAEEQTIALALEKERLGLLTQFIQNATHEFRTPLAVINSSTYMLSKSETPEQHERYTKRIEEQVMRTTKLVDMLLEMVKLESQPTPVRRNVSLNFLVRSACEAYKPSPDKPTLQIDAAPDLPHIGGDSEQLEEAIQHIVDNAVKYTPADGAIFVRARVEDAITAVIEVEDTGIGISEAALPHIFELFWRQDESHTTPGLGLGLSITQKIIHMHGGKIKVKSEVGKGSLFRIVLPISPPPPLSR